MNGINQVLQDLQLGKSKDHNGYVALSDRDSMKFQQWLGHFHMDCKTTMHINGLLTLFQECLHVCIFILLYYIIIIIYDINIILYYIIFILYVLFLENCQKSMCIHCYSPIMCTGP